MKKSNGLLIAISLLLLLSLIASLPAVAQTASNPEANKATLTAFFEAEAARHYELLGGYFTQDFIRHSVATTAIMPEVQVTNLAEYVQFLQATAAMFPDYYNTPQMLIAEGDYVGFYTMFTGTYAENGSRVEIPISGYVRFEGTKIAEMWVEWDNVTWNNQMVPASSQTTEAPINSINDLVGTWRIHGEGWAWFNEYSADGFNYVGPRGCAPDDCVDRVQFTVEGNQIHMLSSESHPDCGDARYDVFVIKQGEIPVGLRYQLVGSDCYAERVQALDGKIVYPVLP